MFEHQYAVVNGIRLHYVTAGTGPTMLFLHGFPEFWYAWKDILAAFSADHQVVAPDLRGYNLSDKPENVGDYTMPHLVGDVRGLLDQMSPGQPAILVGHDWGGVVAWAFAMAHPEYLEKLVIINAPHPAVFARELAANPAQQQAVGYMSTLRDARAETLLSADNYAALGQMLVGTASRPDAFSDDDRVAYHAAWAQPGALTSALNYYRANALGGPPSADSPPASALTVHVPTLVIWGEQDRALLTGNLTGLDQFVPQLQIKRILTGSHWVVHEEPEAIARTIREFL
ncbi:MAG TPA: alpha/beta hydrolase [Chloroflexia bacterium]|nr:alpha/beta hydrolase [Chloroflexia bacterium]